MIHERFLSLFSNRDFTPFQLKCRDELINSGKDAIITTSFAVGEQIIPEFAIIRLLQSSSTHVIFYIFGNQQSNFDYFYSRYSKLDILCKKIVDYSNIEESDLKENVIYIITFSNLVALLQKADVSFLEKISLVAFECINTIIPSGLDSEIFFIYLKKYKFRIVGNNYSYELRDRICTFLDINNESKENLTYNGNKNDTFDFIMIENDTDLDKMFIEEISNYLPLKQVVIFCNASTHLPNLAKLVSATFTKLINPKDVEIYLAQLSDRKAQINLSNGIGILNFNDIYTNKITYKLFVEGKIKVLITLPSSLMQIMSIDSENNNFVIENVFIKGNKSNRWLSILTPQLCKKVHILVDEKQKEKLNSFLEGKENVKLPDTAFLPRYFLFLLDKKFATNEEELRNCYKNCFNNTININDIFSCLLNHNLITEKFEITEYGHIAKNYNIVLDDFVYLTKCKPPHTVNELLKMFCLETETIKHSVEIREGENEQLRVLVNDPNLPFDVSFLKYKKEFQPGEKAYILVIWNSVNEKFENHDFLSDLTFFNAKLIALGKCYCEISDLRKSYWGISVSRDYRKRISTSIFSNYSPKMYIQFPNIGKVYSEKFHNKGIRSYHEFLSLTQEDTQRILERNISKIGEVLRNLPNYTIDYTLDDTKLKVTVTNKGGFTKTNKKGDDHLLFVIGGIKNTDQLLLFNIYHEYQAQIDINLELNEDVDLDMLEFRAIDSSFIGPDVMMKISPSDTQEEVIWTMETQDD
ncbi:hypothetical protein TRFO_19379 [Tritrichomonas foetus]|uniref:SEC63 domain-containing protein n=1 Tax=Tritrichomonas foetus TaxID=1144522 RepID=A0A1J4KPC3_9EUKA|nr:hypothetical protein TRFO_19379 [Tritrichomonas foetus]|eukprot:OHT11277.1 hypothetical protein TRFO_19379 [Tritrichomonas foetus]